MSLILFAKNMRYLRETKQMTQKQLGKKIFASRSCVAHMERCRRLRNEYLRERVCDFFGKDMETMTTKDLAA